MYITAQELLDLPELKQQLDRCEELIISLDVTIDEPEWTPVWDGIKADLVEIGNFQRLRTVADELKEILATSEPLGVRLAQARSLVDRTRATLSIPPNQAQVVAQKASQLLQAHAKLLTQPAIAKAAQKVGQLVSQDYIHAVSVVSGISLATLETEKVELPWLRQPLETATINNGNLNGRKLLANPSSRIANLTKVAIAAPIRAVEIIQKTGEYLPSVPSFGFCIPANPIVEALRLRTDLNLYKLRTCRNIAGIEREIEPYTAPTDVASGLPQIGSGGQLILPGIITLQPTPYRYSVIIERAKQLVQLAAQMESALLSALEKRDAEYFNLLKARQDLGLARAGVRLQDLQIKQAEDGVKLAELQQERTQIQADFYDGLIESGRSLYEDASLAFMAIAVNNSVQAALLYTGSGLLGALTAGLFGDSSALEHRFSNPQNDDFP